MTLTDSDEAKKVLRAAFAASGATQAEFHAALLGVLSTMVNPVAWAEANSIAANCFRDRRRPADTGHSPGCEAWMNGSTGRGCVCPVAADVPDDY